MHSVLQRQLRKLGIGSGPPDAEQWALLLERIEHAYAAADQDRYTLERALELSSTEMRKRFADLRAAQAQLVLASRKAGMADVATSVLHNVGNVLNSVNASANMLSDLVKTSARGGLGRSLGLLKSQPSPGRFIDEDPKGQKLVPYLTAVDKALTDEADAMMRETRSLTKHIEHIKSIVGEQLASARGSLGSTKVVEQVQVSEILDDAISVLSSSLASASQIKFAYDREPLALGTDRHKVFQIVLNLLGNARDAIAARPGAGIITLRARRVPENRVEIEVEDDGVGIAEDSLARIFNHGFTTKTNGHGFGLHASACAAVELGGSLVVRSNGLGCGATFTLLLANVRPASRSNEQRTETTISAESSK